MNNFLSFFYRKYLSILKYLGNSNIWMVLPANKKAFIIILQSTNTHCAYQTD